MILTQTADIALGQAGLYGLLGYVTIFAGLILLMLVVTLVGKFFTAAENRKNAEALSAATVGQGLAPAESVPAASAPVAPGSAGGVKLYNVEPKIAAMLMAIVADKLQKPLSELRFISIKEVSE